ncbi:hypothetical protein KB1_13160 [Cutibacterium modestum]|uniref:Uncharacterized protein n=2 Tax=Cutibacterium modestum TaxID=2559073 RepID=A0AAD1NW96_9ACTN|nr:hypothetical protein KB1_13160 [Cutibacterium modestum]
MSRRAIQGNVAILWGIELSDDDAGGFEDIDDHGIVEGARPTTAITGPTYRRGIGR